MGVKDSEFNLLSLSKAKQKAGLSKTLSLGLPHMAHNYFLSIKGKLLWALGRSSHPHFLSWEGHSLL